MSFTISIDTDNNAFYDEEGDYSPHQEVADIVRSVLYRIRRGENNGKLYDCNGNCVGSFMFVED